MVPTSCTLIRVIIIIGVFEFSDAYHSVYETKTQVTLMVLRKNGTSGDIDVPWSTHEESAKDYEDYVGGSGTLRFGDSEVCASPYIHAYDSEYLKRLLYFTHY